MFWRLRHLTAALLLMFATSTAGNEEAAPAAAPDPLRATFQFRDADPEEVLAALSQMYGVQIITEARVAGLLTVNAQEPVDADGMFTLLDAALRTQGRTITRSDGVAKVVPLGIATSMVEIVLLQYADPKATAEIINQMFRPRDLLSMANEDNQLILQEMLSGLPEQASKLFLEDLKVTAVPYPRLKAVVVRAPESILKVIKSFVRTNLDQPGPPTPQRPQPPKPQPPPPHELRSWRLKYVPAQAFSEMLNKVYGVAVQVETNFNMVLLRSNVYSQFDHIDELIGVLDHETKWGLETFYIRLNNANAEELVSLLNSVYTNTRPTPILDRLSGRRDSGITDQTVGVLSPPAGDGTGPVNVVPEQIVNTAPPPHPGLFDRIGAGLEQHIAGIAQVGEIVGDVFLVADRNTNGIIIRTAPRNIDQVKALIQELDRAPAQVLISVFIAEIALRDILELGADFAYSKAVDSAGSYTVGKDFSIIDAAAGTLGGTYSLISDNFDVFARALQENASLDVISRPQVLTLDNHSAIIELGEIVPLLRNTTVSSGGNVTSNIDYERVTTRLEVTPHVNPAGYVILDIEQEINRISDETFQISETFDPQILTTRRALTQLQVRDGQTVFLGGFISDSQIDQEQKVPLLGDIPILGYLFKSTEKRHEKSELIIFITPHILEAPSELLNMTNDQRELSEAILRGSFEEPKVKPNLVRPPYREPYQGGNQPPSEYSQLELEKLFWELYFKQKELEASETPQTSQIDAPDTTTPAPAAAAVDMPADESVTPPSTESTHPALKSAPLKAEIEATATPVPPE